MRTRAKTEAERRDDFIPAVRVQGRMGKAARRQAKQMDMSITDWLRFVLTKALAEPDGDGKTP